MRLKLNGCDLEVWRCGRKLRTIPLGSCSGGGGTGTDSQTLSINSPDLVISGGNSVDLTPLVKALETLTTLDSVDLNGNILEIKYTGEDGVQITQSEDLSALKTNVAIADLLATGNKIAKITVNGTDFEIKETITSIEQPTWDSVTGDFVLKYKDETGTTNTFTTTILPTFVNTDDQQLTGDTTGNVELTLTPVTVGGITNYTIKADVKLAVNTPNGKANALKVDGSNQLYVEPETITQLKTFSRTGNIITLEYVDEAGTTTTKTIDLSKTTTSITPQYGNGTTHLDAIANDALKVADVIKLSDGSLVNNESFVNFPSHGFDLHTWYFLDATTAGGVTKIAPSSPNYKQRLFYVLDANTLAINVQEGYVVTAGGGGGSTVTFTQTQSSGTKIGEISINGTSTDIFTPSFVMSKTRILGTANQTSFTLTFTPLGDIQMFRNGAFVDTNAYTVSGTTVTYTPSNNGGASLGTVVAGDIITFFGISK